LDRREEEMNEGMKKLMKIGREGHINIVKNIF